MAMTLGNGSGPQAQINVTPLIDVLLVLLIIFMVVAPLVPAGLPALLAQPPATDVVLPPPGREIVISVAADGGLRLNQEDITLDRLSERMRRIYAVRCDDVVFVRGDRDAEYRLVARAIDVARGAGMTRVALMTN